MANPSRLSALLLSGSMVISCIAQADDNTVWFAPHIADTGVSLAALQAVEGAAEINPLGFPGVVVAKFAMEGIALSRRDAETSTLAWRWPAARAGVAGSVRVRRWAGWWAVWLLAYGRVSGRHNRR